MIGFNKLIHKFKLMLIVFRIDQPQPKPRKAVHRELNPVYGNVVSPRPGKGGGDYSDRY